MQVSGKVAAIVIIIAVVIAGYLLWGKTGKKASPVSVDRETFRKAYEASRADRPGVAQPGTGTNQMEAIQRARAGQGQPMGGGMR